MFWDASAIIPLVFPESRSDDVAVLSTMPNDLVMWWGTTVECHAAAHRRHRDGKATTADVRAGLQRVRDLASDALVVLPDDRLRARAERLLAAHPLKAADALQLAAALTWCEEQPWNERFVCLDKRLREAARKEGFSILPDDDQRDLSGQ